MKSNAGFGRDDSRAMSAVPFVVPAGSQTWTQSEALKLVLVPTVATLLYVGGIYWIRSQLAAEPSGRERSAMIQVQLLPRPSPESIPVAATEQPSAGDVASRVDHSISDADAATVDLAALTPTKPSGPTERPAPGAAALPAPIDAPPSGVTARFQQTLLRHVARYQRYPKTARSARLHGAVDVLFSMRRDGTLLGVWIKTSSGQALLDKEALDAIRRAQPLPPIPPEMPDLINERITLEFDPS
ncbi:TonB family protein [Bradyrhizobium sp. STM 3843]|nr:TonB family protein [Bradyrhizobium sp. STM 3843]